MSSKILHTKNLYPWVVWLLAASFFFYKYLIQVSPGVMSAELMGAFSLTGTSFGHLAACFFYGYLIMQIPVGILLDKWDPGKLTAIAFMICSFGVFLFAQSGSLLTASVSRFIIGLSASFAAVACFKLASIWFPPRRFAFIAGLSMTVAMFGAIGGQSPLADLIAHHGWRHALELIALVGVILSIIIWLTIKQKTTDRISPESTLTTDLKLIQKLKLLIKHKQTWFLSLYSGLAFAPVSIFGGLWGTSFLQEAYQLDTHQAANFISLIFMGFALGCPITGWISDYFKQRKPIMLIGTLIAFICLSCIVYLHVSAAILSFLLIVFGIGASCFFLCFSMIRELHPLAFTGTVLGFMNTFDSICEALTEPLIGMLLDFNWHGTFKNGVRYFSINEYHSGLSALLLYLLSAILILFFIHETYPGSIKTKQTHLLNRTKIRITPC